MGGSTATELFETLCPHPRISCELSGTKHDSGPAVEALHCVTVSHSSISSFPARRLVAQVDSPGSQADDGALPAAAGGRESGWWHWLRRWGQQGLEFLYPPACRLCGDELPPQDGFQRGSGFCAGCQADLLADQRPGCDRCGAPVGQYASGARGCHHCQNDDFAFETVLRLGVYERALKLAIIEGKRRGAEGLVAGLGELFWQRNAGTLRELAPQVVVPIPHNAKQSLFRPHNPAAVLAEAWAERLRCPWQPRALVKTRWTVAQARLRPIERRENLKGVFTVRRGTIPAGATVLLADDVLTTGSTAHEAALALRAAGAARVVVAVVARGLGRDSAQ